MDPLKLLKCRRYLFAINNETPMIKNITATVRTAITIKYFVWDSVELVAWELGPEIKDNFLVRYHITSKMSVLLQTCIVIYSKTFTELKILKSKFIPFLEK